MSPADLWCVVLAGGDGRRLHPITADARGAMVPKQFCSLEGGPTLLETTLARAERLVPSERIVVSVTEPHRRWWRRDLRMLPEDNIVSQPANRGTLAGVLSPLFAVVARRLEATVVLLPSDHAVADEVTLETAVRGAVRDAERHPEAVVLLGMEPDGLDAEYGWIVPDTSSKASVRPVLRFVEKPSELEAARLRRDGALISSFILVARAWRLLELCESLQSLCFWSARVARWWRPLLDEQGRAEHYRQLPEADLSRDVLECATGSLLVRSVPPCGWCDLGTPDRLARWLERRPPARIARRRAPSGVAISRPVLSAVLAGAQVSAAGG